tara:strand:- start:60 stop:440 length:381 start_codon:yes stop_codon:yes gene_type:complete
MSSDEDRTEEIGDGDEDEDGFRSEEDGDDGDEVVDRKGKGKAKEENGVDIKMSDLMRENDDVDDFGGVADEDLEDQLLAEVKCETLKACLCFEGGRWSKLFDNAKLVFWTIKINRSENRRSGLLSL